MLPLVAAALLRRKIDRDRVGAAYGVLIGVLAGLGGIGYFAAMQAGKASLVGPVTSLFPLLTVLLAVGILKERMNRIQLAGVVLGLISIAVLSVLQMPAWILYSGVVIVFWGVVGLFQKLGTNRISAHSLVVWFTVGYFVLVPIFLARKGLIGLGRMTILIGVLGGFTNGLGAWYLFASLEAGAKASIAVPLTALNPLLTIILALGFLGERLTLVQWVGVAAALIAGAMISYESGA